MLLKYVIFLLTVVSPAHGEEGVPKVIPEVVHFDSTQIGIAADAVNSKFLRDALAFTESDEYLSDKETFIRELLQKYDVEGDGFDQEWRKSFEATDEFKQKFLPHLTLNQESSVSVEGGVGRDQCFKPVPYGTSNCCKQCGTYGVLVNKGSLHPETPCAPPQTWYKCSSTGCFGEPTGTCTCEETTNTGYLAIIYDLFKDALFFAESDEAGVSCLFCGDGQQDDADFRQFMELQLPLEQCPDCGIPKSVTVGCRPFASCPAAYDQVQNLSRDCWFGMTKFVCESPFCE